MGIRKEDKMEYDFTEGKPTRYYIRIEYLYTIIPDKILFHDYDLALKVYKKIIAKNKNAKFDIYLYDENGHLYYV